MAPEADELTKRLGWLKPAPAPAPTPSPAPGPTGRTPPPLPPSAPPKALTGTAKGTATVGGKGTTAGSKAGKLHVVYSLDAILGNKAAPKSQPSRRGSSGTPTSPLATAAIPTEDGE